MRLGVLASHEGTNLQAVLDACRTGRLAATPAVVISNNGAAPALQRAREAEVPARHIGKATHPQSATRDAAIAETLLAFDVDVVILLGYLKRLGPITLDAFAGRIINLHPALLPRHGGKGMFGLAVHRAVLASGDHVTGASVHVVTADYDAGPLLRQQELPVLPTDTAESLAARVLEVEHALIVTVLADLAQGGLRLPGGGAP